MPGLVPWNLRAFEGGGFCMGLGGFGRWCQMVSWNSNVFTRFGFEQIVCQENAVFLADADWKSLCLDLILAPKQHVCVQSDQLETSLFRCQILDVFIQDCVAAPSLLQPLVSVVGTFLTWLSTQIHSSFHRFLMGSISLVWLTSLCLLIGCCTFIWCHAFVSGCWDWREKAEKDSWYSIQAYSSKVSIFKLIVEINLLSYSMLWAMGISQFD